LNGIVGSPPAEYDPAPVLETLARHGVDFVVIGGLAAIALGSAYSTGDTDVAYARDRPNLERLAAALEELGATLRGAPPGLPFVPDAETLARGLNFTFTTQFGAVDILGEPSGAPPYAELRRASTEQVLSGHRVRVASIDHLIAMKEAAGRTKDKLHATELRVISDELRAPKPEM
jgi:hypothetical protein